MAGQRAGHRVGTETILGLDDVGARCQAWVRLTELFQGAAKTYRKGCSDVA